MGANGNRRQTLRNNIIQPYESGLLTTTDHKDYNAVVGQELDKVSTATKHMFQGLDDIRKEVSERTKALDALHLTVNDQMNRVMLEISGVKLQIGQGITMDSITDADGNVLSGVLEGIKTQVNAANGQIMVAVGEITNLGTRFDGEILTVKAGLDVNKNAITAANGRIDGLANTTIPGIVTHIDSEVQRIDGVITTTSNGLTQQIAKAETDLRQEITTTTGTINNSLSNVSQLVTTINQDGTAKYKAQWEVKTSVNGLVGGVGFWNENGETKFVVDADKFLVGKYMQTEGKPVFSVENGLVKIADAVIGRATIQGAQIQNLNVSGSAVIGGLLKSAGWGQPNTPGWAFNSDNGDFGITSGGGSHVSINGNGLTVYDGSGNARVIVGKF